MCLRANLQTKHTIHQMVTACEDLLLGHRVNLHKHNFGGKNCFLFPFFGIGKSLIILTEDISPLKVS